LKEKKWNDETEKFLELLRDTIYFESDYEKAAELAGKVTQPKYDGGD